MQNNNYIVDPMSQIYRSIYNAPVYQPQPQQPIAQQQYAPTQELLDYIESLRNQEPSQAQKLRENWKGQDVNILNNPVLSDVATIGRNAIGDVAQIGTGLVSMGTEAITHPIQTVKNIKQSASDYIKDLSRRADETTTGNKYLDQLLPVYTYNIAKDIYNNLWLGNIPALNTKTMGQIAQDLVKGKGDAAFEKAKQAGIQSYEQFKEDPLITSLIAAPNATTKVLKTGGKAALNVAERAGLPVGEVSQKVSNAIQTVEAKFNKQKNDLIKQSDELTKANPQDLELVIKNYTEGTALPENLEGLKNKFIKFQEEYRKTFDDNSLVNPHEIAALQYVQRKTGKTIQEIRRELAPQLEELQAGVTNPSLSFRNKLSDFEHEVSNLEKSEKNFLKDTKLLSELSDNEASVLSKYLNENELASLKPNSKVSDVKKYLGDITREAWDESKISEAALRDVRFQENLGKLAERAEATGDPMLKHLYDGMNMANKKQIGAYTLAGAKIPAGESVLNEGRRFQGRSSSREYGTAEYNEIANAYRNVHNFLDDVANQKLKQEVSNNILNNGTIDGVTKLVGENIAPKDIKYLNPELLSEGRLSEAISNASNELRQGFIPVDKYSLKALESFTKPLNTPFRQGALNDIYNLAKETMLASGTYLGGNLLSGLFGTMLNAGSPQGLIKDIVAAIGSKGALSRELGTLRNIRPSNRKYSTKLAQGISTVGRKLGTGIAPRIDAAMQNMFSEINAQGALRKMGIATENRLSALADMNKAKLGELINDVRLSSMMNTKYRVFPRGDVRSVLSIANPFLDWVDTSTQVTAKMLIDHPVLLGAASAKFFGEIGYDRELQKRLGLKVYTDKPLVTYKADNTSPSGAKEVSINFLPQLTPMEFLVDPTKLIVGNSGAPVLTAVYEATKGKNTYGSLMRRTHAKDSMMAVQGGQRYIVNPETRNIEPVKGPMGDEVLATALRNLFAPVSLVNKTIMPSVVGAYNALTGDQAKWYMPYGQSVFGNIGTGQAETATGPLQSIITRNFLSTGNPRQERSVQDIIKGLGTYYERDYFPEGISGNRIRQIRRTGARQNLIDYGE